MIDRWPFSFVSARPGHKGLLGSQAGPEGLQWVNLSGQPVKCSHLSKEELAAKKKTRKKECSFASSHIPSLVAYLLSFLPWKCLLLLLFFPIHKYMHIIMTSFFLF